MSTGYLDLHSHILPGIDDGSKSWDMTKAMLLRSYEQGVRTIVATPHNYPKEHGLDNDKVRTLCEEAEQMAQSIGTDYHVLAGNEVFYRRGIIEEIKAGTVLTLAGSDYILVEFRPQERYDVIFYGLKELLENGYFPVIAHVERVGVLMESEKRLSEIKKMGCYMQANTQDLMGNFFNRSAKKLQKSADRGYIHFLGSDCHNLDTRPPLMEDCLKQLRKCLSKQAYLRLVEENKEKFLANKYI